MKKTGKMIVEDEAIIAKKIESQLQGVGYDVASIVHNGEKTINRVGIWTKAI